MNVLVDTSIWSLALRRQTSDLSEEQLRLRTILNTLIREFRVLMIGPIRQELLSGVRQEARFNLLRDHLRAFEDQPIETEDYERAAQMSNLCRGKGVASSAVDMLICAVAERLSAAIFTNDQDFLTYSRILRVSLLTR